MTNSEVPAASAVASSNPVVSWKRFWYQRGGQPILHNDYLIPATTRDWSIPEQTARLTTLGDLAHIPCLILLGDPGTGKSFELKAEALRADAIKTPGECVARFDLKTFSERTVERFVLDSQEIQGWRRGEHALTLILDSLDECWRRVESLGPLLAQGLLDGRPLSTNAPHLRIRFGCRAAEWRDEIESILAKLFPEKTNNEPSLQVWVLAPLTRDHVLEYASSYLIDGSAFIHQIEEREVTALAAHPITLRMLAEAFKSGGELGRTRAEVYESGLLRLSRDPHEMPSGGTPSGLNAAKRLVIASRIAAVSVLTNRYLLDCDFDGSAYSMSSALSVNKLLGFFAEPCAGESVSCTRETFAETLRCGLFESQAGHFRSWRHQSYAEYLAARYLKGLQPQLDDIVALFCDCSGESPRIYVQLEETACWLASLWSEFFAALVQSNADVFIRCDPARLQPSQRAKLVAQYLKQIEENEAVSPGFGNRPRLNRLDHPDLAAQLKPILQNTGGNWMVRDAAIDIAFACKVRALSDTALDVMLNPKEVLAVRSGAGMLLREIGDSPLRQELKQRLTDGAIAGAEDVRGHCLHLLWPDYLTVTELVSLLVPDETDHFHGIYQDFRARHLQQTIRREHLPTLLDWAKDKVSAEEDSDRIDELPGKIAEVALQHLDVPAIQDAFVTLISACAGKFRGLFKAECQTLRSRPEIRHSLWTTLVSAKVPVLDSLYDLDFRNAGLWNDDDIPWLLAQAERATTTAERQEWCHVVFQIFDPGKPTHLEVVWPYVERYPEFSSYWLSRTTSALFSEEKNWQKKRYYQQLELQKHDSERKAQAKPLTQNVDEALGAFNAGQMEAIYYLDSRLRGPVIAESRPNADFPRKSIAEGDAWKALPLDHQERVLESACSFLLRLPVSSTEVFDREKVYGLYLSGMRFLSLLNIHRPQWIQVRDRQFWQKWLLVIFAYNHRFDQSNDTSLSDILLTAYTNAREELFSSVRTFFADSKDDSRVLMGLSLLEDLPVDPAINDLVLDLAHGSFGSVWHAKRLLDWLLTRKHHGAETFLEQIAFDANPSRCELLAPIAAGTLLSKRTEKFGEKVLEGFSDESSWGTRVLAAAVTGNDNKKSWTSRLTPASSIRLWEWLTAQYPGDPYGAGHDGTVRLEHDLYHLRNRLLTEVTSQGTPEAVAALAGLAARTGEPWIGQLLANARHAQRRSEWNPPTSNEIMDYFLRKKNPPLCTDVDLAQAIFTSLRRYEATLHGKTPVTELWNAPVAAAKHWIPKDEENLSNCVARHLEVDLRDYHITVARESETRQRLGDDPADWPDLVVTAPSTNLSNHMLRVIIEVKGCWNRGIPESMESQLTDRYMRAANCGIYLVGWFSCAGWNDPDDNRRKLGWSARSITELKQILETEEVRLRQKNAKWINGFVLDCSL